MTKKSKPVAANGDNTLSQLRTAEKEAATVVEKAHHEAEKSLRSMREEEQARLAEIESKLLEKHEHSIRELDKEIATIARSEAKKAESAVVSLKGASQGKMDKAVDRIVKGFFEHISATE